MSALILDTRDDRKAIYSLLMRLSPRNRIAYLRWCCRQAYLHKPGGTRPRVSPAMVERSHKAERCDVWDERLAIEVELDLFALSMQYHLDVSHCLKYLEEAVRKPSRLHSYCFAGPDAMPLAEGLVEAHVLGTRR